MYGMIFLVVGVPDDPVLELRDPGVDAGPVAVAAADAPADDAGQVEPTVRSLHHHGAARIALELKMYMNIENPFSYIYV